MLATVSSVNLVKTQKKFPKLWTTYLCGYTYLCMYRSICMHTCTCVCGYACTSVCAYEGQISASGVFLNNCFIFLRQNLFRKFKSLSWPEELFSDLQLTAPCLQDQNYRCSPHALRFTHGFWAPEVRSLHFYGKHFIRLPNSPDPVYPCIGTPDQLCQELLTSLREYTCDWHHSHLN